MRIDMFLAFAFLQNECNSHSLARRSHAGGLPTPQGKEPTSVEGTQHSWGVPLEPGSVPEPPTAIQNTGRAVGVQDARGGGYRHVSSICFSQQ